jgi:hypothetical protein
MRNSRLNLKVGRTKRCTRAGGSVGFEVIVKRARRVNVGVMPQRTSVTDSKTLLWLDDERDPSDERWHSYFPIQNPAVEWVKTYAAFVEWVTANGLPAAVCFDHDLGDHESGFDAAKWLTEYCLERNTPLPAWEIQSANPIGKENIISILQTFERVIGNR